MKHIIKGAALGLIMAEIAGRVGLKPDELAGVDIQKEYELIKRKKSMLSARLRREVVARWEEYLKNEGGSK